MSYLDPEYTEKSVNQYIADRASVSIKWNGAVVTRDEPPVFDVYVDHDDSDLRVFEHDQGYELMRVLGPRHYRPVGSAGTFKRLADLLVETVTEDALPDWGA